MKRQNRRRRAWAAAGGAAAALAFGGIAAAPASATPRPATNRSGHAIEQFAAERIGQGVLLRWIPAADAETLGYNVYRRIARQRVRVNDTLIAATDARGHAYRWLDRTSHHRARYWLEAVLRDGTSSWRGEATAG
jgi:hypothetical protein